MNRDIEKLISEYEELREGKKVISALFTLQKLK